METKVTTTKIPKTGVEQTKGNEKSYPYLYPIGDLIQRSFLKNFVVQRSLLRNFLVQGSFHRGFHVCTNQGINSELGVKN
jgi:hypothetical protein